MQILINNQLAAIKQGSSFDFVAENRYFSGADSYTLAITFPLKDCPQNIAIFGHINRKDVVAKHILFDCEIRDKAFVIYGSITITEISETEVKCQFLEGKSVQNYDVTFDEVYINELELGYPDTNRDNTPCQYPYSHDKDNCDWLALPWVNNNTGNIQNKWKAHHTLWADRVQGLSFQPYMIYLVKKILDSIGFTYDFATWELHPKWRYLLCCNTLPYAWNLRNWARALPHWTITELLEQLELLMNCEFDVDLSAKKVTMKYSSELMLFAGDVAIDNVVDEFSETIVNTSDNKYKALLPLKYADCSHRMWKYMSCPKAIAKIMAMHAMYTRVTFDTATEMTSRFSSYITEPMNIISINFDRLYHINDVDMDFAMRIYKREAVPLPDNSDYDYRMWVVWQAMNQFGPTNPDATDSQELKIVPAWLDEVINENKGVKRLCIFIDCPDMQINDGQNDDEDTSYDPEANKEQLMTEFNSMPCYYAAHDNADEKQEFFDKIYVAFWKRNCNGVYNYTDEDYNDFARWPFPVRDSVEIDLDWTVYQNNDFTLRIAQGQDGVNSMYGIPMIDPTRKYTIKFLADSIPNPRAVFYIHGRKYVCEKLTATFTENGMSQLIKGEFYPMID